MHETLRVLIVDDNPDDRLLALRELRKAYPTLEAQQITGPEELAQALEAGDFDLVITDYQLRWTDGLAVLRAVKERRFDRPVVMLTGTGSEEIAVEAMIAGMDDYVLKSPRHLARLPTAVRQALRRAQERQARREAESRYRSLFENVPVGLYRTGPRGQILDANPALVQMLGYPDRETLLTVNVADLYVDLEDREQERILLERQAGVVNDFETRLSRYDGRVIWVRDSFRTVRNAEGQVMYYEGSLEDITARKQAEEEIQRLLQAEQQRRQVAETLYRASAALSSTLDLNEVLGLILEQLGEAISYDSASVQRLRDEGLEIVACRGFAEPDKVMGLLFPLEPKFPNYGVVTSKAPLAIGDVIQKYPHFQSEAQSYASGHIRSWLGVPLLVKDQVIGMIAMDRAEVHPYVEEEVQLAMAFANQAAMALQNARLFEEAEGRRLYLEGVLKSAPDAIVTLDADHRIVEWNAAAERLFGYSAAEVIGQDLDPLITNPDVLEEAIGLTETVLSREVVHPLETVRYRKDGTPVDVIVAGSPIMEGDRLIGVIAVYSDISERKRAEKALRRRLDELTALHAIAAAGTEATDEDTLIERATQIIGETLHLDNFGVVLLDQTSGVLQPHPSHRLRGSGRALALPLGKGIVGQVALTGQPRRVPDVRHDPDYLEGDPNTSSELCVPLKAGEHILGVINTESTQLDAYSEEDERLLSTVAAQLATAIEKVRLFQETQRLKEFNESLVQNMAEGIVVQDAQGVYTFVNPAAAAMLGYTPAELVGQDRMFVVPPDQQPVVVAANERRARGESDSYELDLRHRDGSRRSVLVSGTPRFEEGRFAGTMAVFADITERKRAEEALRRALEETARSRQLLLALSQAAQAVQRAHTPAEVYRTLGDEVAALGHHVAVLTLSRERDHLTFSHVTFAPTLLRAAEELAGAPLQDVCIPLKPGSLLREVLDEGEPRFVEQWSEEHIAGILPQAMHPLVGQLAARLGTERSILVPLTVDDTAHGLLIVSSPNLSEADSPAMAAFANQAAIAVENARLLEAITRQRRDLQRLSAQLVAAQEAERKRISQELHDEMGQLLTAMKFNLDAIKKRLPSKTTAVVKERLAETASLADRMLEQMREISLELRPSMLDDLGLRSTLRWYVSQYTKTHGIQVELEAADFAERLPPEVETALYRVVQEALTNVAKHAQASRVRIRLGCGESTVTAVIEDNGQGFDPEELASRGPAERGAGLLGMGERITILGGELRIESRPGQGTRLTISVPVLPGKETTHEQDTSAAGR